jgi:voltage-gated potassium channel
MQSPEPDTRRNPLAEWALAVLALVFLLTYAWPILDTDLEAGTRRVFSWVTSGIWLVFALEFLWRMAAAGNRVRFLRNNLFDLAVLALPLLRPLRALRLITVMGLLNRRATPSFRGRTITYVGASAGLVVLIASLAELDAERGSPEGNITTFGDALWWAVTTVTTVGYGDHYPTTGAGRLVALALMTTGIALLGTITAALASWFVERLSTVTSSEAATQQKLDALTAEIQELKRMLSP